MTAKRTRAPLTCEHCGEALDGARIARHFAARGGEISRNGFTSEDSARLHAAKARKLRLKLAREIGGVAC